MIDSLAPIATDPAILVGVGGAIGAILRHRLYLTVSDDRFPWPTLLVNVLGSFVFGLVAFAGAGEPVMQFVALGICGAFTTFATFSVETVGLWERGDRGTAVWNATSNLVASLAAIGLAWVLVAVVVG